MTYTLDGTNPKDGRPYEGPFEIGPEAARLLIYARSGEATKTADFQIPSSGDKTVQIDEAKPARLNSSKRVTLDTTDRVFGVINHFKDQPGTRFKGVRIEISDTGTGVAREHIKEIGRPFFTTKAGGIGLGAATAKRIVTAHGGSYEFRSTEGAGSTTTLTIPTEGQRTEG